MIVEPVRYHRGQGVPQGHSGGYERTGFARAAAGKGAATASVVEGYDVQPALHLLNELAMGGPFGVPESRGGMYCRCKMQLLELCPKRVVVGVSEVVAFAEHGPDEGPSETGDSRDPLQLLYGHVHILQGHHGGSEEPTGGGAAEICDPIVVCPGKGISHVGVFNQVKTFCEPRGV